MKYAQLRNSAILMCVWLALLGGCTKSPSDLCEDGSCCGNGRMSFVRELEGVRGEWGPGAFNFAERLASNQVSALTCPNQASLIASWHLKTNTTVGMNGKVHLIDSSRAYPYQVWGSVYELTDWNGLAGPVYGIVLKRVEPFY